METYLLLTLQEDLHMFEDNIYVLGSKEQKLCRDIIYENI